MVQERQWSAQVRLRLEASKPPAKKLNPPTKPITQATTNKKGQSIQLMNLSSFDPEPLCPGLNSFPVDGS